MGNLKLTSSAFEDGGEIPRECGYKNGNEKPLLAVSGIPEKTDTLVLIMDDPDAMEAVGKVWLHWIVWDIIPTMKDNMDNFPDNECIEGVNDFGESGYGGPAPPDKRHTYVFKAYALDCAIHDVIKGMDENDWSKPAVEKAMEGHIIEQATLTGTYAP